MSRSDQPEGNQPTERVVEDLLARAGAGDPDAWRALLGMYARRVYALALSRLHDGERAEEVTQSVFVTVAESLGTGRYAERGRFEQWLFRVAANRVRDEARRRVRHARTEGDEALRDLAGAEPLRARDSEAIAALRRAIETLSEADREVIELRHHAGLAFKQIAAALRQPLGTVLARHHRALGRLREALESEETDEVAND